MTMLPYQAIVLCAFLQLTWASSLSFPSDFKFGSATASYQVEGGWDADGKGPSIWDRYVHEFPGDIKGNATGDVAGDSYHQWREDVKAAAKMKLQFYRFSINWPRVLPTGFANEINPAGVKYYSDLIDALLAEGIEPIVTIFHWELPVKMQDLGGWTNPLIVKWFGDYARVVYTLYADRVKTWLTLNEPNTVCDYFYNSGVFATRIKESDFAPFLCNKHMMLAHATAYRIFDKEFRPKYKGKISIAPHALWIEPATPEDEALAELGRQHQLGRYSHPIYSKEGGWPPSVEKVMLEHSLQQGHTESRLPAFTEQEIEFMKGTADYYAMNQYTTYVIRPSKAGDEAGMWFLTGSPELQATLYHPEKATYGTAYILPVYPEGMRKMMSWVKQQYGDYPILITENGFSSTGSQLDDHQRVDYIKNYLEQILLAMYKDKVKVMGYTAWSLIDSFEWMDGYETKFGLYEIDYNHPNRTRTPRLSSFYYSCVIAERSLDVAESCYKKDSSKVSSDDKNEIDKKYSPPVNDEL
ncbi:myrosinase 1 isoform X2 [Bicyclus anynana]|uniref:beta-glucosidase n=1 Tax=Bicyclus anynana TaxID=110368 RepID=A0A6J1P3Z1_BICAN|nr:myrosinase 1 isoform X2 [Bicyclus anynana]